MVIIRKENTFILSSIIALIIFFEGCATYRIDRAQRRIRRSFASGNFEKTAHLIKRFEEDKTYKSRDKVLLSLEKGTIYHFSGKYDSSFVAFNRAEKEMDRLFTKSISRGVASFMVNDNLLAYNGEDYENIYLNAFNCLNFIHQNNLSEALVEAKRITYKLQTLNIKYEGLARALSRADTTDRISWKSGKTNFQNSAFGHFLSGIIYAKNDRLDDARIEYEQMLKSFSEHPSLNSKTLLINHPLSAIKKPDSFNLALISFTGRSPVKYEVDTRVYLQREDFYLKLALPVLKIIPSRISSIQAVVDDSVRIPLYKIEDMDKVAMEVYKVKEPIIYARTFVRTLAKATGTNYAKRKLRKSGKPVLSGIVNLFGKIATETTEKADLRGWQTMPGQVYVNLCHLSKGNHKLNIEYYSLNGRLLFEDQKILRISGDNALTLTESLYWN